MVSEIDVSVDLISDAFLHFQLISGQRVLKGGLVSFEFSFGHGISVQL